MFQGVRWAIAGHYELVLTSTLVQNTTCPTCRRPFVDFPREQTDRATERANEQPVRAEEMAISRNQLLRNMAAFTAFIEGPAPGDEGEHEGQFTQAPQNRRDEADDHDDRNEFSSMYS